MASQLVVQGIELMLVGMGTVFVFLTTLVIATSTMSRLVMRFLPVVEQPQISRGVSSEEVAAITAAIAMHQRNKP